LFLVLFYIFGTETISKVKIFQELMPIDFNNYWFICNYIVLFLMSPYLNRIVNYCSQKELKRFVLILFATLSIIPAITAQATIQNNGLGVIHFIFIYFIGAYLRKYPIRTSYHFKNIADTKYRNLLIIAFLSLGIGNIILYNFGDVIRRFNVPIVTYFGSLLQSQFLGYSSPISVLMSVIYFLFFETLSLKSKWINHFAATTFGIYLIHDNAFVRRFIYKFLNVNDTVISVSPIKGIIALIGYAVIIYFGCMIIEETRIILSNIRKGVWKAPKKKQTAPAFIYEEEEKKKDTPIKEMLPKKEKKKDKKENENPDSFIDF
ncbi:MAG: hypothetical protein IJ193_01825, partial [Bacilli bacterium]|nr:hypothetical protein [Bacilli bacterium]